MYLSCFTIFTAVLLSQDLNSNAECFIGLRHTDVPLKQTSSIAVAGAVIGAVLALFIIAVFVTVLLTPRKKRPAYLDKVIDLPPTHKPPPVYKERAPALPEKDHLCQTERSPLQTQFKEKEAGGLQPSNALNSRRFDYEDENSVREDGIQQMYPLYNQMCCQDRSPRRHHQNNPERLYINPREHYV
uniref:Nectin cell adhesion molecule 3 n=1 Tax=Nannospalax galili TaxID=1026970 RepID=A0A8C6WAC0_NANGA